MTPEDDKSAAQQARDEAAIGLAKALEHGKRVHTVATSLRNLRQRNHFGEGIERAMNLRRSA